ncbi:MAG: FAD-binding oxidoreductase [Phycisphaeraceae bacterium]
MPDTTTSIPTNQIEGPDALADLVRGCIADRKPIVDYGIAHTGLGHRPPAEHVKLVQRASGSGVIEHYEQDMTGRVAAGATIGRVQHALRQHNQFLPIDADDDITIGEVINHNVYGPLRVAYGSMRDLLLGLHYIDGQGRDIHVGGRTVKNVAGYDVTKLIVGSLGELGIIYEATLRTYAVPTHILAVDLAIDDPATIDNALADWLANDAAPATMMLAYQQGKWLIRLGYYGRPTGCTAQRLALEALFDNVPAIQITATRNVNLEDELTQTAADRAWRRRSPALVKVIVPPASTGVVCNALAAAVVPNGQTLRLDAMPVHGCIFVGGPLNATQTAELDHLINQTIAPIGGQRAWYAKPDDADRIEPIAPRPAAWPMLLKLKRVMDPSGIFNPNRFIPVEDAPA